MNLFICPKTSITFFMRSSNVIPKTFQRNLLNCSKRRRSPICRLWRGTWRRGRWRFLLLSQSFKFTFLPLNYISELANQVLQVSDRLFHLRGDKGLRKCKWENELFDTLTLKTVEWGSGFQII
jgi:hypothetical protein